MASGSSSRLVSRLRRSPRTRQHILTAYRLFALQCARTLPTLPRSCRPVDPSSTPPRSSLLWEPPPLRSPVSPPAGSPLCIASGTTCADLTRARFHLRRHRVQGSRARHDARARRRSRQGGHQVQLALPRTHPNAYALPLTTLICILASRADSFAPCQPAALLMDFLNTPEKRDRRMIHVPMGRFGEAIEQAKAVLFCAYLFLPIASFIVTDRLTLACASTKQWPRTTRRT